jgi:hypothetical protein
VSLPYRFRYDADNFTYQDMEKAISELRYYEESLEMQDSEADVLF